MAKDQKEQKHREKAGVLQESSGRHGQNTPKRRAGTIRDGPKHAHNSREWII